MTRSNSETSSRLGHNLAISGLGEKLPIRFSPNPESTGISRPLQHLTLTYHDQLATRTSHSTVISERRGKYLNFRLSDSLTDYNAVSPGNVLFYLSLVSLASEPDEVGKVSKGKM